MSKRESKKLEEKLTNYELSPEVRDNLASLEQFIEPELFAKFQEKILKILNESPESEKIVGQEISLASIKAENLQDNYYREFRSILTTADAI
ncbi:hypothetical protein H3C61_02130 [Candidatus Gracilibacteria bacterium]|nr:hypothetical protein [Candidatus Gracilibacteria bacterium]